MLPKWQGLACRGALPLSRAGTRWWCCTSWRHTKARPVGPAPRVRAPARRATCRRLHRDTRTWTMKTRVLFTFSKRSTNTKSSRLPLLMLKMRKWVCLLLLHVLTTELIILKFCMHVVRSTEKNNTYLSLRKIVRQLHLIDKNYIKEGEAVSKI